MPSTMLRNCALMGAVMICSAAMAQDGPVLHYAFDEGAGPVLHDRSGHGNDAAIEGAQWVRIEAGFALEFDGQKARAVCKPSPSLDIRTEGAIEVWFRPAARQGGLAARHTGGGWPDLRLVLAFFGEHGAKPIIGCVADGAGFTYYGSGARVALGAWTHLVMSFDGAEVRFYQDGLLTNRQEQGFLLPVVSSVPLVLGQCEGLGPAFYKGGIGQVRVFNRALSESEAAEAFHGSAARFGRTLPQGTGRLSATAAVFLEAGRIDVEADLKELLPVPEGARVEAELRPSIGRASREIAGPLARTSRLRVCLTRPGGGSAHECAPPRSAGGGSAVAAAHHGSQSRGTPLMGQTLSLDAANLPPGDYDLSVAVKDAAGREIGAGVSIPIAWKAIRATPATATAPSSDAIWLVRGGRPQATIVIPAASDATASKAAGWLAAYIEKATGARLAVISEDQPAAGTIISVGRTRRLADQGLSTDGLRWDGCRMAARGDTLFLFGRDEPLIDTLGAEGTGRAVARFLEDYVGIRWLAPTPQGEYVPRREDVGVPRDLDKTSVPAFAYSHAVRPFGAGTPGSLANNFRVAVRVKSFGGHSYYSWLPTDKYFKDHPEYFALIEGKRTGEGNHLCSTNPDVRKILLAGIRKEFDSGHDWVQLGQEDGYRACECPDCQAQDRYDGTPEHPCERVLLLHKWIADECAKSHPGKIVHLLVYNPTVWPSKKFDKWPGNVVAELCNQTPEVVAAWKDKVSALTGYVYWGDITLPMGMGVHATPAEVAERIRFFHESGFIGLFQFPETNWGLAGPAWYTLGKLMGDPYLDYRRLQREYCLGLYGPAAETMDEFYNRLYEMPEIHARVWPAERIGALEALLARAEKQAPADRERNWVRLARDHFDYCRLTSLMLLAYRDYRQEPGRGKWQEMKRCADAFEDYRDRILHYDDGHVAGFFPGHSRYCNFLAARYAGYYDDWKSRKGEILSKPLRGTQVGWGFGGVSAPLTWDFSRPPEK